MINEFIYLYRNYIATGIVALLVVIIIYLIIEKKYKVKNKKLKRR